MKEIHESHTIISECDSKRGVSIGRLGSTSFIIFNAKL